MKKAFFDEIVVCGERLRLRVKPAKGVSKSGRAPCYVHIITPVEMENIGEVEKAVSKKYKTKGVYCTKKYIEMSADL